MWTIVIFQEILHSGPSANNDTVTPKETSKLINPESGESKNSMVKRVPLTSWRNPKRVMMIPREESIPSKSEHRTEASGERNNERDKDRGREREKWTWKVKEQKHGTLIEKGILTKNRNEMRLMRTKRK